MGSFQIQVAADGHSDRGCFDLGLVSSWEEAKQKYKEFLSTDQWEVFWADAISPTGERIDIR